MSPASTKPDSNNPLNVAVSPLELEQEGPLSGVPAETDAEASPLRGVPACSTMVEGYRPRSSPQRRMCRRVEN